MIPPPPPVSSFSDKDFLDWARNPPFWPKVKKKKLCLPLGNLYFENCGRIFFCNTSYFCQRIAFCHPHPTSDDENKNKKCPTANFKKAFVPLYILVIAPFMTHPNISFPSYGPESKKICFLLNSFATRKKTLAAYCELNFDATDLPHSLFEPLYPKLSMGTLKVDLVPLVWHPALHKVRKPRFLAAQTGPFGANFGLRPNGQLLPITCHTYSKSYDN